MLALGEGRSCSWLTTKVPLNFYSVHRPCVSQCLHRRAAFNPLVNLTQLTSFKCIQSPAAWCKKKKPTKPNNKKKQPCSLSCSYSRKYAQFVQIFFKTDIEFEQWFRGFTVHRKYSRWHSYGFWWYVNFLIISIFHFQNLGNMAKLILNIHY